MISRTLRNEFACFSQRKRKHTNEQKTRKGERERERELFKEKDGFLIPVLGALGPPQLCCGGGAR